MLPNIFRKFSLPWKLSGLLRSSRKLKTRNDKREMHRAHRTNQWVHNCPSLVFSAPTNADARIAITRTISLFNPEEKNWMAQKWAWGKIPRPEVQFFPPLKSRHWTLKVRLLLTKENAGQHVLGSISPMMLNPGGCALFITNSKISLPHSPSVLFLLYVSSRQMPTCNEIE